MTHPGSKLRALARRFCDQQTMERLIDPAIADLQCEYAEAIRRGQLWRSRWVRIAGYGAVAKVGAIGLGWTSMDVWSEADGAVSRTLRFSGIATLAILALLIWPPVSSIGDSWPRMNAARHAWLVCTLVPQALVIALPLGLMVGILAGLRGRVATGRVRRLLIALGVACGLAMFVLVGWLMPAANQTFREITFHEISNGRMVWRGINELTITEIASGHVADRRLASWGLLTATRRAFEVNFRLALASAPLALGLFSLGVAAARRRAAGRLSTGAIAVVSCFAFYVLMYYSRFPAIRVLQATDPVWQHIPEIGAVWGPNLAFLMAGLFLWRFRKHEPSAADPNHLDDGRRSADRPAIPLA